MHLNEVLIAQQCSSSCSNVLGHQISPVGLNVYFLLVIFKRAGECEGVMEFGE